MFEEHRIEPREFLALPLTLGDGSTAVTRDISASGMYFQIKGSYTMTGPVLFEMHRQRGGWYDVVEREPQLLLEVIERIEVDALDELAIRRVRVTGALQGAEAKARLADRWDEFADRIPFSRETWRKRILNGRAPAGEALSSSCTVWRGRDILAWLSSPTTYSKEAYKP